MCLVAEATHDIDTKEKFANSDIGSVAPIRRIVDVYVVQMLVPDICSVAARARFLEGVY